MIGLTTHPAGGKGYQMYLDGALVADMAATGAYQSAAPDELMLAFSPRRTLRIKRITGST